MEHNNEKQQWNRTMKSNNGHYKRKQQSNSAMKNNEKATKQQLKQRNQTM